MVPGIRTEIDLDGERIFLDSEPQKPRRWSRRRRRAPNLWSPQDVYDHVRGCYQAAAQLIVVVAMSEDDLPQKLVREVREANDGVHMEFEWWGFGWGGDVPALALADGPLVLCETWGFAPTLEEARRAAKSWAGDGAQEVSLLDIPRWPLLATLEVVRLGSGNIFRDESGGDS